jgi:cyanophycinase
MKYIKLLICVLALSLTSSSAQQAKGRLVIIGGGERTERIMQRFVAFAGAPEKARIVVIPMASSIPDTVGTDQVAELKALGARNVECRIFSREQAASQEFAETFNNVTGIFFSGGDQAKLTAIIVGTPVQQKLKELYRRGAVVGGTSAGAAIMSEVMITGDELINKDTTVSFVSIVRGNVKTIEGIGFLQNVIIDQHFAKRKRHNRLMSVVLEHPKLVGMGIDESTALIVNPDFTFETVGSGSVIIYDARNAQAIKTDERGNLGGTHLKMSILLDGDVYALKSGKVAPARKSK